MEKMKYMNYILTTMNLEIERQKSNIELIKVFEDKLNISNPNNNSIKNIDINGKSIKDIQFKEPGKLNIKNDNLLYVSHCYVYDINNESYYYYNDIMK